MHGYMCIGRIEPVVGLLVGNNWKTRKANMTVDLKNFIENKIWKIITLWTNFSDDVSPMLFIDICNTSIVLQLPCLLVCT